MAYPRLGIGAGNSLDLPWVSRWHCEPSESPLRATGVRPVESGGADLGHRLLSSCGPWRGGPELALRIGGVRTRIAMELHTFGREKLRCLHFFLTSKVTTAWAGEPDRSIRNRHGSAVTVISRLRKDWRDPGPDSTMSYNPTVRRVAQRLHVGGIARKTLCGLLSSTGKLRISCLDIDAVFQVSQSRATRFCGLRIHHRTCRYRDHIGPNSHWDVFLDVGCNCGIYSVLASKLVGPTGRVIAVEPNPVVLQLLRENIAINDCRNVEVGPQRLAITDRSDDSRPL